MNKSGSSRDLQLTLREHLRDYPDPSALERRLTLLGNLPADIQAGIAADDSSLARARNLVIAGDEPCALASRLEPGILLEILRGREVQTSRDQPPAVTRERCWLAIALAEQSGDFDALQSARNYSALADRLALRILDETTGGHLPRPVILALGKWGSSELNACSDIDPVLLAPDELTPETADRVVRDWNRLLSGTREQPVYRVDLRLRPDGDSGPLAWSFSAVERYLLQRAAPWERIAWLRARPVGDLPPAWFLELLDHFLFSMGGEVRERIRQVAAALAGIRKNAHPRDVKRAPGGIRDLEFFTAAWQISEGFRNPDLRRGAVSDLLARLKTHGFLDETTVDSLRSAYLFLRRLEHALQVETGRPRFVVPEPATPALARIAFALGMTPDRFEQAWSALRRTLKRIIDEFFQESVMQTVPDFSTVDPQADPAELAGTQLARDARARSILHRLSGRWGSVVNLCDPLTLLEVTDTTESLARLEASVNAYGGPEAWTAAFSGRPRLLSDISRMLVHGRRIVEEANQRPYLWERIGVRTYSLPEMGTPGMLDRQLGDLGFHLGESFLARDINAEDLTATWSNGVDRIATILSRGVFENDPDLPPVALLASGKWGGHELAPDGDLDLLFICGEGDSAQLGRAVQVCTGFLTTLSLNGRLFPDARLRPEGSGAPICVTISRLESYLTTRAAPWEKLALARARRITGNRWVGMRAQQALREFAATPPSAAELARIHLARKKAAEQVRIRTGGLNIKKSRGGMMDFEFAVAFASWRLKLPAAEAWAAPLFERMRALAERDPGGNAAWQDALKAYGELRRWELAQAFSSAHRRSEIALEGEDALRFAAAAGLSVKDVVRRWEEISQFGRRLYDKMAERLIEDARG